MRRRSTRESPGRPTYKYQHADQRPYHTMLVARTQRLRSLTFLAEVQVLHRPIPDIQHINGGRVVTNNPRQGPGAVV